jgi:hypothetical protein
MSGQRYGFLQLFWCDLDKDGCSVNQESQNLATFDYRETSAHSVK